MRALKSASDSDSDQLMVAPLGMPINSSLMSIVSEFSELLKLSEMLLAKTGAGAGTAAVGGL